MSSALRSGITFVMGSAIFVGLPLLGWGVTDIPGFLGHPVRIAYVVLVLLLNGFAAIRIPEIGKGRGEQKVTVPRQHVAVVLLQVLSISVVLLAPFCDRREIVVVTSSDLFRYVGLLLYAVGFLIMHIAEASLGKQFSVEVAIQTGHSLVTDGLYRYLRHPRYLGIIVFMAGIALAFRSWLALALDGAIVLVLIWRIRDEEALMSREFGSVWEAYVERTWRLLPFLF
jgi:protein-S-isoprenylcysteine O-methyltransferase Ste14